MITNYKSALRSTFFLLILAFGFLIGCVNTAKAQKENEVRISLFGQSRGYTKAMVFSQDSLVVTERGIVESDHAYALSSEQVLALKSIIDATSETALAANFEAEPEFAVDAALRYSIVLDRFGKQIKTDHFDLENPPDQLKALVSVLMEIQDELSQD